MAEFAVDGNGDNHDRARRPSLRRNIVAIYSAHVVNGILSIVVVPTALRHFGTEGYGLFAIYGVLSLCCNFLSLGPQKHFTRLLASEREARSQTETLRAAWAVRLIASTILLAALPPLCVMVPALLFPVDSPDVCSVRWLVVLAVIEYVLAGPTDLMSFRCIASERIDRYSLFVVMSGLYRYGLMLAGIFAFGAPVPAVALIVARRLIDPWVAVRVMGSYPRNAWRPKVGGAPFWSAVRSSAVLSFSEIGHVVMLSLGSVLANTYCGLAGLGLYRAAFDLTTRLWMISNGLAVVAFPRFVRMLSDKDGAARDLARLPGFLDASWAGYLVVCAAGAWLAPWVLPLIGIPPQATQLFVLLLLGTGMNAHGILGYQLLQAAGKYVRGLLAVGLAIAAMLIAFVVLYSHAGILAVGWAWMVSQFIYVMWLDMEAGRLTGRRPAQLANQVAYRIILVVAAAAPGIGHLSHPSAIFAAATVLCLLALSVAFYGLRTVKPALWEGHQA